MSTENYPKRIIFISGYGYRTDAEHSKLEAFAHETANKYLGGKVIVNNNFFDDGFLPKHILKTEEFACRKSAFFTEVLFQASLPSTKTLFLVIPNLTLRVLMQFLALFDEIKKLVYFVFDTTNMSSVLCAVKPDYEEMIRAVPEAFKVEFNRNKEMSLHSVSNQVALMTDKKTFYTTPFNLFNDIFWSVPPVLKPTLFRSIFDEEEFCSVPFLKVRKTLVSEFATPKTNEEVLNNGSQK